MPTVYTVDEYEPLDFDAVLVKDATIVCLEADQSNARVIPLDKVNHVDADPELMLTETDVPDSFYGGARYAFLDPEQFPTVAQHLDELAREEY